MTKMSQLNAPFLSDLWSTCGEPLEQEVSPVAPVWPSGLHLWTDFQQFKGAVQSSGSVFILRHICPDTYARILSVTSNRRFTQSSQKQSNSASCETFHLSVDLNLLTDKSKQVKLSKHVLSVYVCNRLSNLILLLYTSDCISGELTSRRFLKFEYDTTVISRIWGSNESAYRQDVDRRALLCGQNNRLTLHIYHFNNIIHLFW